MVEFRPWSKKVVNKIIKNANKKLVILDIQLSGACNLACIYCDTPKYEEPCLLDIQTIERFIAEGNIEWIYICGLGEPTNISDRLPFNNMWYLKQLLTICKKNKIGLSMFTNLLELDVELMDYIDTGILYPIYKLDTFDRDKIKFLYGADDEQVNRLLHNYQWVREVLHTDGTITNQAASIVPTVYNYEDIPEIIDYCHRYDIFELIGQLENAGKASGCSRICLNCNQCTSIFKQIDLSPSELAKIKNYQKEKYQTDYEIPICAATFGSVHITSQNMVICDEDLMMSCPFYQLDEPRVLTLGDARNMPWREFEKLIIRGRYQKVSKLEEMMEHAPNYVFGGCGGNMKKLLKTYQKIYK